MKLSEYFAMNRPEPKYEFGARVFGHYEGIPFIGSVGADNMRSIEEGPMVSITPDLPIKIGDAIHNVIRVPYKAIKSKLISYDK